MPHLKLPYSLFCKIKPFWIVSPDINTSKQGDVSAKNTTMVKWKQIGSSRLPLLALLTLTALLLHSLSKAAEDLCCDTEAKACMNRECLSCRNKLQVRQIQWRGTNGSQRKKTMKKEWQTDTSLSQKPWNRDVRATQEFQKEMKTKVCKHLCNIHHQYTELHSLHQSMKEDEVIPHIDYAENWQCKYAKEVQQVHYEASGHTAQCCHVHHRGYTHILCLNTFHETWPSSHLGSTSTNSSVPEGELSEDRETCFQ